MRNHRLRRSPESAESARSRRLSFSNCDLNNPTQLNHMYNECADQVHKGLHPVSRQTAIRLAAVECFVLFGPYKDGIESSIRSDQLLPKEYARAREHEKNIKEQYSQLLFESELAAMRNYCDICRSLPTYGMTFFVVKEPAGNRLVTRLFGVNKECVMTVDAKSKIVLKTWPMEQLRRWAASTTTFNIDFGDYKDGYYSVKTLEGEKIKKLIAEFVDIILKKKQMSDPYGIEGDEGAIMIEENILPAQVMSVSFSELSGGESPDREKPGVRTPFAPLENVLKAPKDQPLKMGTQHSMVIHPDLEANYSSPLTESLIDLEEIYEPEQTHKLPTAERIPQPEIQQFQPQQKPLNHITNLPPAALDVQQSTIDSGPDYRSSHFSSRTIRYEMAIKNGVASKAFNHQFVSKTELRSLIALIQDGVNRSKKSVEATLLRPIATLQMESNQRAEAVQLGQETIQRKMLVFIACAAQIIEWTSKDLASKERLIVDAANTMMENLEDVNMCIWELCSIINKSDVFPLIELSKDFSSSFIEFLQEMNPERMRRSTFLASASKLGEIAFAILNSLNEDEVEANEDQQFFARMNESIQAVASSTAALILQTKVIPPLPSMDANKMIVESATEVAVLTSELIALSRVLSPIIGHPACQERVSTSGQKVTQAVKLLVQQMCWYCNAIIPDQVDEVKRRAALVEVSMQQLIKQIQE